MICRKYLQSMLLLAFAALLMTACSGGAGGPTKNPVSGLWVDPENLPQLQAAEFSALTEANIGELFIPLAKLDLAAAEGPVVRRVMPALAPALRLNVVVEGSLNLQGREAEKEAASVAQSIQQVLLDAEGRGAVPIGVHFDLEDIGSIESATTFFSHLRTVVDRSFLLSMTFQRSWVDDQDFAPLARSVDFVVPFLYGQRISENDSEEAWSFTKVRQRLEALEKLRVPYMVGIIGIGKVTHRDRQGAVKNFTSAQALYPFMWDRNLEMEKGFSLQTTQRRAYTLIAQQATRVGDWNIAAKDEVLLVRPMTIDLEQLLEVVAEAERPNLIGQLYYRLPSPEERLSIKLENIFNALDPGKTSPDLTFEVRISRRTNRGAMYRFVISNRNGEPTEFSLLKNNYVEIKADANAFGNVDVGDFYRYNLLRLKPNGEYDRMFRDANVLRLHIPILEGRQQITSGDVEILRRQPTLSINSRFLMPDGRSIEYGPFIWRNGELEKGGE